MPLRSDLAALFRPPEGRLRPIAGLRAISIFMVMAFHTLFVVHFLFDGDRFLAFMLAAPAWVGPVANGDKAVDAFFVLSGFLLAGALLRRPSRPAWPFLWRFWRGRLYRILPLFYVALAVFALAGWDGRWLSLLANLLFVDNILPGAQTIVPVGWSLAIEMQFCLVLPLLVLWSGPRLAAACLWLIALALAIKVALVLSEPWFYRETTLAIVASDRSSAFLGALYYPTWARYDALLMGVVAAAAMARGRNGVERHAGALLAAGLLLIAAGMAYPGFRDLAVDSPAWNAVALVLHRPVFALGVTCLLLAVLLPPRGPVGRAVQAALAWRFWQSWSEMLFPLYLFHFPMIAVAAAIVFGTTDKAEVTAVTPADLGLIFLLGAGLSWLVALPLHLFVERPMHDRGRRDPFGGADRKTPAGGLV